MQCPNSLQFRHGARPVRRAHRRVVLDHAKRLPPALLANGLDVDAGHDTAAGPMMPPVVDMKIFDVSAPACRRVGFFDRASAWDLVATRIAIRLAAIGQED